MSRSHSPVHSQPSRDAETDPELNRAQPGDERTWLLTNNLEQLNRTTQSLLKLLHKSPTACPAPITIAPVYGATSKTPSPHLPPGTFRIRPTPAALQPPPGNEFLTDALRQLEVVAVNLVGLEAVERNHAFETVRKQQRCERSFKPVFITDSPDFSAIVRAGYVAEYISDWELNEQDGKFDVSAERLAHIKAKWGVDRVLDFRSLRAPAVSNEASSPGVARGRTEPSKRRQKALVVCWDLGHNPAGRGMVLYDLLERDWDVELVGPLWSRFGGRVWAPIAGSNRKVRGFPCRTLEDFWPAALAYSADVKADLVVVCKPRFPALVLGALIKQACGCPLVLDIDDFELSFFPDETAASLDELAEAGPEALSEPYAELPTRACDSVLGHADATVVSNVALRARFGGTVVRHARDEEAFTLNRFDRDAERRRMGMAPEDFSIVFVGTARRHKGVFRIAETLAAMTDKRFVFHLVGDIPDRRVRYELDRHVGARIAYHPNCAFDELPARLAAADAVVLLQEPEHPISKFQIPAKVSDASALGLPILVSDVPPLTDLALQGVVTVINPDDLAETLQTLIEARATPSESDRRRLVREAFESELGFRVNRERLEMAIRRARERGPTLPEPFERLIEIAHKAYLELHAERRKPARRHRVSAVPRKAPDLVMFWKQNDTGMYGRRSDSLMKHLLASGRIGRILQFDAPAEIGQLAASAQAAPESAAARILGNTVANQFGLSDGARFRLRTFLWSRAGRRTDLAQVHSSIAEYPRYVQAEMQVWGMRPENSIAWVCPVVFDFPAVARHIPFHAVVGDLIDDQRNFEMSPSYRERIIESYEATLPLFDLAFTNCEPQVAAFRDLVRDIAVVPNGTDLKHSGSKRHPAVLEHLTGPIAGYVGNLRDRFDWALMREVAQRMADVQFVIVGGGARERDIVQLNGLANVTFTGPVPHEEVPSYIRRFDVALVPHTLDLVTDRMNPLKIYSYFAARRPIVSTGVANVDAELRPYIRFADSPGAFSRAIRDALDKGLAVDAGYRSGLQGISWEHRTKAILTRMSEFLGEAR